MSYWLMPVNKKIQLNWSAFFLQTFFCLYFLITPLFLAYFFDVNNPNNTAYNIDIISKHFLKISVVIICFSYLISLPFLFIKQHFQKTLFILLFLLFYSASILDFLHVILFKSRANSSSYFSIFSSNQNERLEFVLDYSSSSLILGLLSLLLFPFLIYFIQKRNYGSLIRKVIAGLFTVLLIISTYVTLTRSDTTFYKEISIFKLTQEFSNYKKEINLLNTLNTKEAKLNINKTVIKEPETYIFIIGESTSKFHMQLYGYERNTTPELMKFKKELILFNNIKSSAVHTVESLKDMFVLTDKNNNFTNNTLIDCFNEAGFSTYWLSNQSYLGENETPISAIAKRTTQQVYINTANSNKLDEELLPELKTLLNKKDKKRVLFIHLMGTHLSYQDRYPNSFNVFTNKNISVFGDHADSHINQYDNAILYNDYIVSEIIKTAKNIKGIATVTYLSDHGDEVYDFRNFHGHSGALLSRYMTNVPFFIWGNTAFKSLKNEQLIAAYNNSNSEFSLKNFSHTIQDLFEVKSVYYQKHRSFFSEQDSVLPIAKTQDSTNQTISNDPFKFDSKIWVHRVNSLTRLAEIEPLFKGMELDVVFENGKFDVRHPPTNSINLSLEKFLTNVDNPHNHYFWLDLKNLTLKNADSVIERLNYITQKFNIKQNIIVETTTPEAIPKLNKHHYFSSYYLNNLASLSEFNLSNELKVVSKNIRLNNPTAISQNINNYFIMSENFKKKNKLIWTLNLDWNNPNTHQRIENLLRKDSTIKVCLVNYKTDGWR